MRTRLVLLTMGLGFCLAMPLGGLAKAEDWPQWRGPGRDGHLAASALPEAWPKELKQQWKVEVGTGHSSPVVAGSRVYVFGRQDDREIVRALELADGRRLWSQSYAAPYEMSPPARGHGKGPKSTPVVADGKLFTLGISGILSAWDAASGKRLWQHEFSKTFDKTSPLYGTATSPAVEAGLLIAHVGGHNDGALTAFDAQSGEIKWQWAEDGPAYTSPILATLGGTRQIVTQSQNACIGVSAGDGSLLWSMPFKTQYDMNIVTPVLAGDLAVFSGFKKGTGAYRVEKGQDQWTLGELWQNPDFSMFMSSPVLVGKRLFGFAQDNRGQLFCLDVAGGKTLWTSDGRMGDNAALVSAGDAVLALTTGGELIVFDAGADRFDVLARYKVADTPTWAHPVVVGKRVLIKDESSLAAWTIGS